MQLQLRHRQHRSRKTAEISTGIVTPTVRDAFGFAEPLARYGELPTSILTEFYRTIHGLSHKSTWPITRLKELFHERAGLDPTHQVFLRPTYQWRHGINHQTIYRRGSGTGRFLLNTGTYDQQAFSFIGTTSIVQLSRDDHQAPSDHDAALSVIAASIEITARRSIKVITHIDILKHASAEAQHAASPLSIPIPKIEHTFPGAQKSTIERNTHIKPDALLGFDYADDQKFAAVEYDRSTEDVEPTKKPHPKVMAQKDPLLLGHLRRRHPGLRELPENTQSAGSLRLLGQPAHEPRDAHRQEIRSLPRSIPFQVSPTD